jgi:hypothetical protein
MITRYGNEFDEETIVYNLNRIINQIYRLLPVREEKGDWQKPLDTLIIELVGMASLFSDQQTILLTVLSKSEGMKSLVAQDDFMRYRRTIFECLGLLGDLKECWIKQP